MSDDGMKKVPLVEATVDETDPTSGSEHGGVARGRMSRRRFIATSAATGVAAGAVALPSVRSQEATPEDEEDVPATPTDEAHEHAMEPAGEIDVGFQYFVPFQAAIVAAAAARIIPTDDLGPGATEAGVVYFIDRQLAKDMGFRGTRYEMGPFLEPEPTQGDQSALSTRDRFRLGIQGMEDYAQQVYGEGFAALDPDQQDRILRDMENGIPETFNGASIQSAPASPAPNGTEATEEAGDAGVGARAFFDLLLSYTFAGFFADPVQGGNRDMVGWKLIGFPGAHVSYTDWILRYGEPFDGDFISLAQYQQQMAGGS